MANLPIFLLLISIFSHSPAQASRFFPWLPTPISASSSPAPSPGPLHPSPSPSPDSSYLPPSPSPAPPSTPVIRGAYWPSGSSGTFPPSAIDTTYFTHIYYAFVLLDPTTYQLNITEQEAELIRNFSATLHSKEPPAKRLLSIGGYGGGTATIAQMASTAANRAAFIGSTIAAARFLGLDGLDLDWEYPQNKTEMDNLGLLFKEWRTALVEDAAVTGRPLLLLTAAVYFAAQFILEDNRSYPAASIRDNLDWINAMCYDYRGGWNTSVTGAHAALFDPKSNLSTSFGLRSWVGAGVPAKKVVMGLPLYGRTWQLKDPAEHGIGAPAVGLGPGRGVLVFSELMNYNSENNATEVYDGRTVSMYSYSGTAWIGYDGGRSVKKKIYYAKDMDLGGYFFWALGFDMDWMISHKAWRAWS